MKTMKSVEKTRCITKQIKTTKESTAPDQNKAGSQPKPNMPTGVSVTPNKNTPSITGTTIRSASKGATMPTPSTPTSPKGRLKTTRHILKHNYPSKV